MLSALKNACEDYIAANGGGNGLFVTPADGLALMKSTTQVLPQRMIYRPALCVVVQGAKQVTLGDTTLDYAAAHALVVSVELPAFGGITRASTREPFIGLTLEFDVGTMRDVMERLDEPPAMAGSSILGLFIDELTPPLIDCLTRLVRLLAMPDAIPILYPGIMREVCFWLLTGANGSEVCKLVSPHGHTQRIADAIYVLRQNFSQAVRIEQLASAARMSVSSFHQHFKALTSMTPLQYQKQLRLLEARNLLTTEAVNVTDAAFRVGYESTSQFSREYKRMFGTPPKRDAGELRKLYHRHDTGKPVPA